MLHRSSKPCVSRTFLLVVCALLLGFMAATPTLACAEEAADVAEAAEQQAEAAGGAIAQLEAADGAAAQAKVPDATEGSAIFQPKDESKLEQFKARVFNGLIDRKTEIDVSDIGITSSEIIFAAANGSTLTGAMALAGAVRAHPLFSTLCVSWQGFSFSADGSTGAITTVRVTYLTYTWTQALTDAFKERYTAFAASTPVAANELQKALYVHDWICSHVSYSMQTQYNPEFAIGAIAKGKALCAGYAYAYQFLAQQLGLECNYVAGTTKVESHAWNKVRICGQWFLVDTTWDNSLTGTTNYSHTYCLLNDTEFAAAGDGSHGSDTNVTGNEPTNTATSFGNKYWASVRGPVSTDLYTTDPQLNCNDHVWDEGVTTKEPTCTEAGSKTLACTLCGTTKTEEVNALGHDWQEDKKEPTCTEAGYTQDKCSRCGVTQNRTDTPAKGHTEDAGTIIKEATCTETGTKEYKCSICKAVLRTETIASLGHNWGDWKVTKEATTSVVGTQARVCARCKAQETKEISKLTYINMYRLYNPNSGEHFYTASAGEKNHLVSVGWIYEGVGWRAPLTSSTPVYRLYSGTDHHYTTNAGERDSLVKVGWRYEGICWYSDDAKGVALYRQFNPNVDPSAPTNNSGSHNYTASKIENDKLIKIGWRPEGIGWYGLQ